VFEIGGSLREVRERRELSLDDAQQRTLIRSRYLGALEDERFSVLPGEFYVRTFLREYAEFLGLDGDLYVAEYLARTQAQVEPPPAPPPRFRARDIGVAKPAIALAVTLVLVVAAWSLTGSTPRRRTLAAATSTAAPRATHPRATPAAPRVSLRRPSLVLTARDGPCWVLVRLASAGGNEVYQGTIQPGQTVRFGLRQTLWIRLGAPWNVEAEIGGRTAQGLPARTGNVLATGSGLSPA